MWIRGKRRIHVCKMWLHSFRGSLAAFRPTPPKGRMIRGKTAISRRRMKERTHFSDMVPGRTPLEEDVEGHDRRKWLSGRSDWFLSSRNTHARRHRVVERNTPRHRVRPQNISLVSAERERERERERETLIITSLPAHTHSLLTIRGE